MNRSHFGTPPRHDREASEAWKRGERICRECGKPTVKPRLTWCSKECVDAYNSRQRRVRDVIWERDQGQCALCPKKCGQGFWVNERAGIWQHEWEADHIVPLIEGGAHTPENVRTLCLDCHKAETKALRERLRHRRAS